MYDAFLAKDESVISSYEINDSYKASKVNGGKKDKFYQHSAITVTNKRLIYSDTAEIKMDGKTNYGHSVKEVPLKLIDTVDTMYYNRKTPNKFLIFLFGLAGLVLLYFGFAKDTLLLLGTAFCALICFLTIIFAKTESALYLSIGYLDIGNNREKVSAFSVGGNKKSLLGTLLKVFVVFFILYVLVSFLQSSSIFGKINTTKKSSAKSSESRSVILVVLIGCIALLVLLKGLFKKFSRNANENYEGTSHFYDKNKAYLGLSDSDIKASAGLFGEPSVSYNYINPDAERLVSELGAIILNNK